MLVKNALYSHTALPLVGRSLDAAALRSKAIANNLANVTTPGYSRMEVSFEDRLKTALENREHGGVQHPKHIRTAGPYPEQVRPEIRIVKELAAPGEINNVDIDMEAAKLAENQLSFLYGVKVFKERKEDMDAAISGRPR